MEQTQITKKEGNRIIAKFMGAKSGDGIGGLVFHWPKGVNPTTEPICHEKHLQYHSSWDWLMPVVDKIESMGYDSRIHTIDSESTYFVDFVDVVNENTEVAYISKSYHEASKIETVWLAIVQFIQWYNQNQLTN